MKKILLGTTALFGAALIAQAALADGPKVTLGGDSEFEGGWTSDDQGGGFGAGTAATNLGKQDKAFYSRNELSVKVDGKSDAGLGYGGEIWLSADTSADQNGRGINADRTFLYLDGMWGRVEGGSNYGADQTLKIDASSIARATGGIDGDWRFFANNRNGNAFLVTPDLPINYGATSSTAECGGTVGTAGGFGNQCEENLSKLTYYTPKWYGLQAGLSYVPNDQNRGQLVGGRDFGNTTTPLATSIGASGNATTFSNADNIWQGGVNWAGNWDQVGLGLDATAERGDAVTQAYHNLMAWQVGGKATYMGFSAAGSYEDWGKSLRLSGLGNGGDTKDWTLGAAYEYGPYGVSLTYLNGKMGVGANGGVGTVATTDNSTDRFTNYVLGADYKLAPGLTPYVEVSFFDENGNGTGPAVDNTGRVYLIGTQLNF